ncbi:MAG TPA: FHA domain-containing protein [Gemmataceae bacterium]|nr:FHA domain-containing protein [Gemmataceae bacterium]
MSLEVHGQLVPLLGGDPIPLVRDCLTVGRRESCDIPLRFPNVSGVHCELTFRDGYWHIRDRGSTNGIKVNGNRVLARYLHPGDVITIAKRKFTIEYQLLAGRQTLEEIEDENVMDQPLLEKAGLERPRQQQAQRPVNFDPGEFLLDEDEEAKE